MLHFFNRVFGFQKFTLFLFLLQFHGKTISTLNFNNFMEQVLVNSEMLKCSKYLLNLGDSTDESIQDTIPKLGDGQGQLMWTFQENTNLTTTIGDFRPSIPQFRSPCILLIVSPLTSSVDNEFNILLELLENLGKFGLHGAKVHFLFNMISSTYQRGQELLLHPRMMQKVKYKLLLLTEVGPIQPKISKVLTVCYVCPIDSRAVIDLSNIFIQQKDGFLKTEEMFPNFSRNFRGKLMKVSTTNEAKFVAEIRMDAKTGRWYSYRGIFNSAVMELGKRLNFSVEMVQSSQNGLVAKLLPNGTWIGTIGDVFSGSADIGIVGAWIFSRHHVVDFTFPVCYEVATFFTAMPTGAFSWRSIYRPLTYDSWIFLAVSSIVALFSFQILLKLMKGWANESRKHQIIDIKYIIEFMLSSLVEQTPSEARLNCKYGVKDPPSGIRALVCFWLLFVLIMTTAYRSKLVSFLAISEVVDPPESFDELSRSAYQLTLQYTASIHHLFKTSSSPSYKILFERMVSEHDEVKCFAGILTSQKAACISWSMIAQYVSFKNFSKEIATTKIRGARDSTFFVQASIMLQKRTVYLEEFDTLLKIFMNTGISVKWKDDDMRFVSQEHFRWKQDEEHGLGDGQFFQDETSLVQENDGLALTLVHLSGPFYLLVIGIVIAVGTLLHELFAPKMAKL